MADLFGFEAALFTPTGSMANQPLAFWWRQAKRPLCEARARIVQAELGAHGALTGITSRTWSHPDGQLDLEQVASMYAPDLGPFFVRTSAVELSSTQLRWRQCAAAGRPSSVASLGG
ncbi:MAG: beta-eliminating lyase-related protein [Marmoricola sp.]